PGTRPSARSRAPGAGRSLDFFPPARRDARNKRCPWVLSLSRGGAHDLSLLLARVLRLVSGVGEAGDHREWGVGSRESGVGNRECPPYSRPPTPYSLSPSGLGQPDARIRSRAPPAPAFHAFHHRRAVASASARGARAFAFAHQLQPG